MKRLKLFLGLVAALFMAVTGSTNAQTQTPFEVSDAPTPTSDPNGGRWAANTRWYFLHFVNSDGYHSAGYMGTQGDAFINSNGQLLLNGTDKPLNAGGIWCFVGDADNGYKIYNRNTGTSKILSMTTSNDGVAKMLAEGTGGNTQRFDYAPTTNPDQGFAGKATLKFHGSTNTYLNNSNKTPKCHVGVWSDNRALGDKGSVIDVIEATYDDLVEIGVKVKLSTNSENLFYLINKRSDKCAAFDGNAGLKQVSISELSNVAQWYLTEDGKLHNAATAKLVNGTGMDETGCTMYIEENILNPGYFCVSKSDNYTENSWDDINNNTGIGYYAPKTGDADGTSWAVVYSTGNIAKDKLILALYVTKSSIGNNPGNYPQSAIDAAQAVLDNQSSTDDDFTAATSTLQNAFILPVSGKYYTITSAYPNFENSQGKTMSAYVDGTTLKWKATDLITDETFYWQIYEEGGKYVFKNCSTNTYISSYADNTYSMGETPAGNTGFTWFDGGICNIKVAGGNFHTLGHSSGSGRGDKIIQYGNGTTGASAWYIKEVKEYDLQKEISRLENTIATYQARIARRGINPGQYTLNSGSIETLQTKIAEGQTLLSRGSVKSSDYVAAYNAIVGSGSLTKNEMEVGSYYRIQSTTRSTYTGLQVNDAKLGTYKMWNFALDEKDPSQIWKLEKDGDNYFLVNVASGLYPQYVNGGADKTTYIGAKNAKYKFTCDIFAEATEETMPIHRIYFGGTQVNIEAAGNVNYWYAENARHFIYKVASTEEEMLTLVNNWASSHNLAANANAAKISITEGATQVISPNEFAAPEVVNAAINAVKAYADAVSPTLEQAQALYNNYKIVDTYVTNATTYGGILSLPYTLKAQYGTIILPINCAKPTNVKLYSCSAAPNGILELVEFTSGETKNKPFIVEYTDEGTMPTAESSKVYQLIGYQNGAGTKNVTEDLLTGVLEDNCTVPVGSYILSKKNDRMGFFQIGTGTTYNAAKYKCYLTLPAQQNAPKALYFDENDATTAISEIFGGNNGKVEIYDLAGHRLNSLQKGINIVNGQKIIVR